MAVDVGILSERFRENDLRAKSASDTDMQHAKELLAHEDERTTRKYYRRRAEIVRPLKKILEDG